MVMINPATATTTTTRRGLGPRRGLHEWRRRRPLRSGSPPRALDPTAAAADSLSAVGRATEAGATLALVAAWWRSRDLEASSRALLSGDDDDDEIGVAEDEDDEDDAEAESVELVSALFLTALSLAPYLNWIPWVFSARSSSAVARASEVEGGAGLRAYYYLGCALLYALPYVDLLGSRSSLGDSVDLYVLAAGAAHLQLERGIAARRLETTMAVERLLSSATEGRGSSAAVRARWNRLKRFSRAIDTNVLQFPPPPEEPGDCEDHYAYGELQRFDETLRDAEDAARQRRKRRDLGLGEDDE